MNRRFLWLIAFRASNDRICTERVIAPTPQEAIASWLKKSRDHEIDSLIGVSELWEVK